MCSVIGVSTLPFQHNDYKSYQFIAGLEKKIIANIAWRSHGIVY
jgi:hypothetical protein